jgi:outer membrane protein assembly factor BamB
MSDTISSQPSVPVPSDQQEFPAPAAPAQGAPQSPLRLRLWPGVVILVVQWLIISIPAWVAPVTIAHFMGWFLGPMVGAGALAVWWLFASRVGRVDRWLPLLVCAGAGVATWLLSDPSVGWTGLVIYALPAATTAWVLWLVATPYLRWPIRRAGLLVLPTLAWLCFILVRYEGATGSLSANFRYRWSPTTEEQFLAEAAAGKVMGSSSSASTSAPLVLQPGDWPGFRGPERDSRLKGVRIATDWKAHPPRRLWHHLVGPGWSSFAVVGTHVFTQEQWADEEVVVCYDANSGDKIWAHPDRTRFSELMGGVGPRATPTFHDGKLYAQGATGRLNCLDAASGRVLWSHDVAADSGATLPQWGFSASPLVAQGMVMVFAGAPGKSVLGYNAKTGDLAWSAGEGQFSYCSLHPVRVAGVEQVVIATDRGLTAFLPTKGEVLWQHDWPLSGGMARVVQPTPLGDSDFLIGASFGVGTRRVHVRHDGDNWTSQEVWTTRAIKPYFNDLVIHGDHLYGFDSSFLTCVSLNDGKGKWRARDYGSGQVLLLADQQLLLVLGEQGEVALVDAVADAHRERARFQAIEGKTWNHPVVAHGKLFVRNAKEAACFELTGESERADAGNKIH